MAANSQEFAAFFVFGPVLGSFFHVGRYERLRSPHETASYEIELCSRFAWDGDERL